MIYKVEFTKDAVKDLKKLDKQIPLFIMAWVRKNLEGCSNPREHGKGLVANRSGQWRYRVGTCHLIAEIQEERVVILLLGIGHLRDVYE